MVSTREGDAPRWARVELIVRQGTITAEEHIQVQPAVIDLESVPGGILWHLGAVSIRLSTVTAMELGRALVNRH